ncbi:unnamed protein product [Lactuca saligna]|uniref:Uncharacterized protein n=1 Tax=Lactuca saligna TaxID=75948 RepID=A0AA36EKJ5_LACSI|nr:unnamed protein product [Lactuca saligna]
MMRFWHGSFWSISSPSGRQTIIDFRSRKDISSSLYNSKDYPSLGLEDFDGWVQLPWKGHGLRGMIVVLPRWRVSVAVGNTNWSRAGRRKAGDVSIKHVATYESKGKGKGVQVDLIKEKKSILQELEIKRMKQLNTNMRVRLNDPPCLKKGDPNKVWCFETTENITYGEVDAFEKRPQKIYAIED